MMSGNTMKTIEVMESLGIKPVGGFQYFMMNSCYESGCIYDFERVMKLTPDCPDYDKIKEKQCVLFSVKSADKVDLQRKYKLDIKCQLSMVVSTMMREMGVFDVLGILRDCNLTDEEVESVRELIMVGSDEEAEHYSKNLDLVTKAKFLFMCISKDVDFFGFV